MSHRQSRPPLCPQYRATGDELQLHRAQQFALFAAQHWEQPELLHAPDRYASLYEVGGREGAGKRHPPEEAALVQQLV